MIQRVQTVYLFFGGLLALAPLTMSFYRDEIVLLALCIGVSVPIFVNIFLFKNRRLQIKIGKVIVLVLISVFLASIYFISISIAGFETNNIWFGLMLITASIWLISLANKAISKDEKLTRSMDRLR